LLKSEFNNKNDGNLDRSFPFSHVVPTTAAQTIASTSALHHHQVDDPWVRQTPPARGPETTASEYTMPAVAVSSTSVTSQTMSSVSTSNPTTTNQVGMGPGQPSLFGLALENFPLKSQIFQFFAFRVKKTSSCRVKAGSAFYLLGSKLCSGRVRAHL